MINDDKSSWWVGQSPVMFSFRTVNSIQIIMKNLPLPKCPHNPFRDLAILDQITHLMTGPLPAALPIMGFICITIKVSLVHIYINNNDWCSNLSSSSRKSILTLKKIVTYSRHYSKTLDNIRETQCCGVLHWFCF